MQETFAADRLRNIAVTHMINNANDLMPMLINHKATFHIEILWTEFRLWGDLGLTLVNLRYLQWLPLSELESIS